MWSGYEQWNEQQKVGRQVHRNWINPFSPSLEQPESFYLQIVIAIMLTETTVNINKKIEKISFFISNLLITPLILLF